MRLSIFTLFKIGIGPSSSHTMGPMRAARMFVDEIAEGGRLPEVARVSCRFFGSLGATGRGHGSDTAVILGLAGHAPETVDVEAIAGVLREVHERRSLSLLGRRPIAFDAASDLAFSPDEILPFHVNALRLVAADAGSGEILDRIYYSVGGGFVVDGQDTAGSGLTIAADAPPVPYPFASAAELIARARGAGLSIAALVRENERTRRSDAEIAAAIDDIWQAMQSCVRRGLATEGTLPGRLAVRRRAAALYAALISRPEAALSDPMQILDWVNLYALAVNEENAAGGRVVTAPTNGAAGIVPAVLHYYTRFLRGDAAGVADFLLTAGAIGLLYKLNASISGAEVGCQGEVGVACSMAAAGLCAVMGGTPEQVENAAEIGMEHHLGLTCDPVDGLVQIPCIERNAMASVQAINAARMALRGDGKHFVSLDQVMKTMRETGADMMTKYKETARGGLAVNIVEC
ncbi:L-serine ammonia-lyase [Siculibacillus lacustris]|uniref:L-serine dehydratase n=1 Tax=Siculibacillus lacustris TaxID=1549641 RepID=A0A4Q9VMK0_9HYPH|nr:L-serine ammonia-lyase [Siculibacillus lacustris]TBW36800.1 L-serine ammonia-lyase [Siculibacillus lacustris]